MCMSAVPGYQIGLKLWSVNAGVCQREARRLYDAGVYDYLELYAVPGTADTLPGWKALGIPCVVHAAHFKHGFNLAKEDCAAANRRIYDEMRRFADALDARHIIFHGGTFGDIAESARQLAQLNEPRALIENKPCITRDKGEILQCRGATPEEIRCVMEAAGCGFCLDIPHALCAANYLGLPQPDFLAAFNDFGPQMYHLSDMKRSDLLIDDHTMLGLGVLDMRSWFPAILAPGSTITIETTRSRVDAMEEFESEVRWLQDFLRRSMAL